MSFKDRFIRFMYGRYGVDQYSKFLLGVSIVLCILNIFIPSGFFKLALEAIFWALLIFSYYRIFSKKIYKRAAENEKYLRKTDKIRRKLNSKKSEWVNRNVYKYYSCPNCKQRIRVPKGRGKIKIRCPKCGTEFIKKS